MSKFHNSLILLCFIRSHNPKVVGSNPAPAIYVKPLKSLVFKVLAVFLLYLALA